MNPLEKKISETLAALIFENIKLSAAVEAMQAQIQAQAQPAPSVEISESA